MSFSGISSFGLGSQDYNNVQQRKSDLFNNNQTQSNLFDFNNSNSSNQSSQLTNSQAMGMLGMFMDLISQLESLTSNSYNTLGSNLSNNNSSNNSNKYNNSNNSNNSLVSAQTQGTSSIPTTQTATTNAVSAPSQTAQSKTASQDNTSKSNSNSNSTSTASASDTDTSDGSFGDFSQGSIGDCVFCATLSSLNSTKEGSQKLDNMVKTTDDGYQVTLGNGSTQTISKSDVQNWNGIQGSDQAAALEIAATNANGGSLEGIGAQDADKLLTGNDNTRVDGADSIKSGLYNQADAVNNGENSMITGLEVDSNGTPQDLNSSGGMHAFSVTNIDKSSGTVTVHNPWNSDNSKDITMSIDDFSKKASSIDYAQV